VGVGGGGVGGGEGSPFLAFYFLKLGGDTRIVSKTFGMKES